MDSLTPNDLPPTWNPTCEPATPAHGAADPAAEPDLPAGAQAKLTPADRENMLSLFPEHAERILAASRPDTAGTEQAHTVV